MRRSIHRSIALIALACVLSFATWAMASPIAQPAHDDSWIIWEIDTPIQRLVLRDGALWAGAYKGGLTRWDTQTGPQTTYSTAQGLTGVDVLSAAVDASGATWVALFDGGVARISTDGHVTAVTPTGIGSARPWDLATHGNEVWLATLGGGVAHEQGNGIWTTYTKAHDNLPADDVYAVAVASDGTPWIGTIDYGVATLDGTTWTHYTLPVSITNPLSSTLHLSNNAVTDIAIDASGNKWFATDGSGVVVLDRTNTQWTVYNTHNSGLKSDFVQRVVIDPQGNAWFGTLGGGVARLATDRTTWQVFDTATARLTEDDILDLAVDDAGGLWLATYDTGLSYYGPLPATPPSFDLDPRGLPAAQAGVLKGYSLWLDPETYTWTLAWAGDGQNHTFSGEILADGPITVVSTPNMESGDSATVESNRLIINAQERDGEDLVNFTLDRSVTSLTIRLQIDGAYYPFNLHVGAENARPGMLPFRMAAPQPQAPMASLNAPQTAQEGSPVFFSGLYTDTDSFTGHTINWDLGDGTTAQDTLAFSHTYADNGVYQVTLSVTDQNGMLGTATQAITIENAVPEVTLDAQPFFPEAGQPVNFSGSFFDAGANDAHTFAWDFGDGSPIMASDTLTATHAYAATGSYTTTLRVSDDDGGVGEAILQLDVVAPAPTATPTVTLTDTPSPTATETPTETASPTATATETPTSMPTDTPTQAPTSTPSPTTTFTPTSTPTATPASTPSSTTTSTATPTSVPTVTATPTTAPNGAPSVGAITAPLDPVVVQTAISASASFSDPNSADTHTATWEWGDGSSSAATLTEANGAGTVMGSHTYATAGVYTLKLTVSDQAGGAAQAVFQYVVVYDPSAGFVTGGGWITSPAGAYPSSPSLTGKASFGFNAKYQKGASVPSGQTQFSFRIANLEFHSSSYQWLVVAGAKAQYKGSGTINGSGEYGFLLTAIDGQLSGGGGTDTFRIKIWNQSSGAVVYDNQIGAADDASAATALGGGSIVIQAK